MIDSNLMPIQAQLCLIFLIIYSPLLFPAHASSDSTRVNTSFGTVQGRLVHLNVANHNLGDVIEYLGVPYATPPLGRKRFMPPNSPSKWSTTKDCTRLPPSCIQHFPNSFTAGEDEALKWMPMSYYNYLQRVRTLVKNESEDCLYLNLYVPQRKGTKRGIPLLPVLVLIHGGSYSWGSGNLYNASLLASYGQIIVVTLNYRLGIFGFLSAGYQAPICRGNWALGDIAAALEFLRQTVVDFGGDPGSISLLGWDTGAALVNLLMSSPVSAPAHARSFKRGILLGGSALSPWATVPNPTDAFFYVAEAVGCVKVRINQRENGKRSVLAGDSPIHNIVNCLSSSSLENVTRAVRSMDSPTYLNTFGPTIDGSIVANDPQQNLQEHGDLFRELDLLLGLTTQEAFQLLSNQDLVKGIDEKKRDEIYRTLVQNVFRYHRNEIFSSIVNEYTDWQAPSSRREDLRNGVLRALGDGLYTAPVINTARLHSRPKRPFPNDRAYRRTARDASQHRSTYVYVFTHATKRLDRGRLSGSIHGEDLPYILGYPLMDTEKNSLFNYGFGENERSLSEAMMMYISNFVKSGDPMRPTPVRSYLGDSRITDLLSRLRWPPFVADINEGYLEISERPNEGSSFRAHEVAFWTKFLPSLEKAGETTSDEKHHRFPSSATFYGIVRPADRLGPLWRPNTTTSSTPAPLPTAPQGVTPPSPAVSVANSSTSPSSSSVQEKYSTILSATVAVGCALLILNILIFAGIYHQWDKRKRFRKRLENHYQPAMTTQPMQLDLGPMHAQPLNASIGGTPLGHGSLDRGQAGLRMPPAPPPPAPVSSMVSTTDSDLHPTLSLRSNHGRQQGRHQHFPHQSLGSAEIPGTPRGVYSEQEPLLNRTYISPTCPRHGKQASSSTTPIMSSLEEIQV